MVPDFQCPIGLQMSKQLLLRTVIVFVKLDVRDFYMTGTPLELKDSIKVLFPPGPRCRLLCEAVEYLLSSEYVVSNLVPGRVFSCCSWIRHGPSPFRVHC